MGGNEAALLLQPLSLDSSIHTHVCAFTHTLEGVFKIFLCLEKKKKLQSIELNCLCKNSSKPLTIYITLSEFLNQSVSQFLRLLNGANVTCIWNIEHIK